MQTIYALHLKTYECIVLLGFVKCIYIEGAHTYRLLAYYIPHVPEVRESLYAIHTQCSGVTTKNSNSVLE